MPNIVPIPPQPAVVVSRPPLPAFPAPEAPADLRRYWFTMLRRKWQVLTVVLLVIIPAAAYNFLTTPYYASTVRIQIDPESAKVLPYKGLDETESPVTNFDLYFRTQVEILKGDKLGDRIASRLGMVRASDTERSTTSFFKSLLMAVMSRFERRPSGPPRETLLGNIEVNPIRNTRLIELSYESQDPSFSAKVVNTAAEEFIKLHFSDKYQTTEKAVDFLNSQLSILRAKVEQAEGALIRYARENGILNLSDKDKDVIRQRLERLNDQMTQVEGKYMARSAQYDAIRGASPSDLPSSLRTPFMDEIEKRLAEADQKLASLRSQFDENWPEVVQLRKEVSRVEQQLADERKATYSRALQQAEVEYKAARGEYQMLSAALKAQEDATNRLNEASVQYNNLKRDVDSNEQLYQALLQRLKETGVSAGLEFGNVHVVEPGTAARAPSRPQKARNLALALMMGLMMGFGLAFFLEYLDRSLKTPEELEEFTGLPALSSIPKLAELGAGAASGPTAKLLPPVLSLDLARRPAVAYAGSNGHAFREACLHLRSSLLLSSPDSPPQVILVTSSIPMEGKTTIAAHLGSVLARPNAPAVLVDLDMRRQELSRRFGINGNGSGMSVFLSGNSPVISDVVETTVNNLLLIPAGPNPPNPADLIGSERMKLALEQLRKRFRFVVIDTPPVLTVADALELASRVDGIALVVRAGSTPREMVKRSIAEIRRAGGKILGMVFNDVDLKSPDYAYYHRYYNYDHYEVRTE
jgi:succinoglycan biosynthesis transport protein ExoP